MNVVAQQVATVKRLKYEERVNPTWDGEIMRAGSKLVPPMIDSLVIVCDHNGVERECVLADTGAWTADNIVLQFMAFCGAKPSELEAAEGTVFQIIEVGGMYFPTDRTLEIGERKLKAAQWFEPHVEQKPLMVAS